MGSGFVGLMGLYGVYGFIQWLVKIMECRVLNRFRVMEKSKGKEHGK